MQTRGKGPAAAVIAAAGRGTRMDLDINKQYIEIQGMPILAMTIRKFENCGLIDEIVVVANKDEIDYCERNVIDSGSARSRPSLKVEKAGSARSIAALKRYQQTVE